VGDFFWRPAAGRVRPELGRDLGAAVERVDMVAVEKFGVPSRRHDLVGISAPPSPGSAQHRNMRVGPALSPTIQQGGMKRRTPCARGPSWFDHAN